MTFIIMNLQQREKGNDTVKDDINDDGAGFIDDGQRSGRSGLF